MGGVGDRVGGTVDERDMFVSYRYRGSGFPLVVCRHTWGITLIFGELCCVHQGSGQSCIYQIYHTFKISPIKCKVYNNNIGYPSLSKGN